MLLTAPSDAVPSQRVTGRARLKVIEADSVPLRFTLRVKPRRLKKWVNFPKVPYRKVEASEPSTLTV